MHHVGILYDQFMMHGQRNIKPRINFSNPCQSNYRLRRQIKKNPKLKIPTQNMCDYLSYTLFKGFPRSIKWIGVKKPFMAIR